MSPELDTLEVIRGLLEEVRESQRVLALRLDRYERLLPVRWQTQLRRSSPDGRDPSSGRHRAAG